MLNVNEILNHDELMLKKDQLIHLKHNYIKNSHRTEI